MLLLFPQATPALLHLAPTVQCCTTAMAAPPMTSRCVTVTYCCSTWAASTTDTAQVRCPADVKALEYVV
jgi:hypothetical protein